MTFLVVTDASDEPSIGSAAHLCKSVDHLYGDEMYTESTLQGVHDYLAKGPVAARVNPCLVPPLERQTLRVASALRRVIERCSSPVKWVFRVTGHSSSCATYSESTSSPWTAFADEDDFLPCSLRFGN